MRTVGLPPIASNIGATDFVDAITIICDVADLLARDEGGGTPALSMWQLPHRRLYQLEHQVKTS